MMAAAAAPADSPGFARLNCRLSELSLRLINPNASANELKTTLMSHSIMHGDVYFAYFNKIWGIP
jgi:hypothetical protein